MGFFNKIDKVFSSSNSFQLLERNEVDLHIEENIKSVGIAKFAVSDYGDLFLSINELGGFLMLETILVSSTNVKTKKGSKLTFSAKDASLKFDSDEDRIESDFSSDANRYSTKIDYNISEEEAEVFKTKKYDSVLFEINGQEINFSVI
ncbi:hypothetical protein N9798_01120 [Flavobacteriaceae bacterium]|jgi:hypothetical protein|nr:hypothetical protein [Flavobacteriaceae bacterium]MDB9759918.1 hypothetical protein [bacterium]